MLVLCTTHTYLAIHCWYCALIIQNLAIHCWYSTLLIHTWPSNAGIVHYSYIPGHPLLVLCTTHTHLAIHCWYCALLIHTWPSTAGIVHYSYTPGHPLLVLCTAHKSFRCEMNNNIGHISCLATIHVALVTSQLRIIAKRIEIVFAWTFDDCNRNDGRV